jgi:hypothetical protein
MAPNHMNYIGFGDSHGPKPYKFIGVGDRVGILGLAMYLVWGRYSLRPGQFRMLDLAAIQAGSVEQIWGGYYMCVFLVFGAVFGQSWAQELAQRPRLEKCCINQRKLARGIDAMGFRGPKRTPKNPNKSIKTQQKLPPKSPPDFPKDTLCYAIVLPGRHSAFRARFWRDCCRENMKIGRPAGQRPAGGRFSCLPGSSPAKIWPGRTISGPKHYCETQSRLRRNFGRTATGFATGPDFGRTATRKE